MEKGLAPIVAVILVLLIAISLTVLAIIWLPRLALKPYSEEAFNKSYMRSRACLSIESVDTARKKLTIKNCGKIPLTDFNFYIDGKKINLYLEKLDPQESVILNYVEDFSEGYHDFFITSDYAETPIMNFFIEEAPPEECDVYIYQSMIPYEITENNKIYCLAESVQINGQNAINFSSGVQNSVLDCQGYNLDGNDVSDTNGIYLTGSNTKNNIIKNCIITNFKHGIYLYNGPNNNILINNTASNNTFHGFYLRESSSNNILIKNKAISNSQNGITIYINSNGNSLINYTAYNNQNHGIFLGSSSNTIVTGDSIFENSNSDYYLYSSGTTNNFTSTNFTEARKIGFGDAISWFNYNNRTDIELWLKTRVSSSATITRELASWSQDIIQWNDTSDSQTTARYNITGLETNTVYYVYNNSVFTYSLDSGSTGEITFTIDLPINEEHEIKVEKFDGVLWFKFDESSGNIAYDSSPYHNDGTLYGGLDTTGWTTDCISGNCLEFDGYNDYVEVPTSNSLNPDYITVEAWIKPATDKIKSTGSVNSAMIVKKIVWNNELGYWLEWNNASASSPHAVQFNIGNGASWKSVTSSNESVPLNQWTHVVGTYDGSLIRIYINGVLNNSQTQTGPIAPSTDNLRIGAESSTYKIFNGTIDEVKIWKRALSTSEIEQEYQQYAPFDDILWFKFNEARGVNVYDSSSYNNDGTFYDEIFYDGTFGNGTAGTEPTRRSGADCRYGSCLEFDGTPNVIADVVNVSDIPNGSLTIMVWIYPKQLSGDERAIVSKWGSGGGTDEWLFRITESGTLQFHINNVTGDYEGPINSLDSVIQLNEWTHVAVVYDRPNKNVSFFKNGTPVGSGYFPYNGQTRDGTEIVRIGAQRSPSYDPFNGTIDEVRIWNRTLTQQEIQAEMQSSLPVSRPLASWSFEESSGNIANDTRIWVNGKYGSALSFDGVNDYIEVPDSSSLDASYLTIIAWIYPYNWDGIEGGDYGRILDKGGAYLFFLAKDGTFNRLSFFYWNSSGFSNQSWSNVNSIQLNTWQHVAVTYDGQYSRFYVNGNPVGQTLHKTTGPIRTTSNDLYVGNRNSLDRQFNGIIDEVRIWNRTLSLTEIQEEMNRG